MSSRRVVARDRTAHRPLAPFTVDHFAAYAGLMVLDSGDRWVPESWQLEVIGEVFAGHREVWLLVAEGNGKSTMMSGLGLYHLDYTVSAMALVAAASRDQAGVLFEQAAGFVERTPGLDARFRVFRGYRNIRSVRDGAGGGVLQVKAADDRTGDGVIPSLLLVDELHRHRDLRLYRTWAGKLDKRGGQLCVISTAGEPGTEFEEARQALRDQGDQVAPGHIRTEQGGVVLHDFHVPDGGDVDDMQVVKLANPLSYVTPEKLAAKHGKPTRSVAHWRRFTCNQPVRNAASAISESEWLDARCDPADEPVEGEAMACLTLDVGWKWDTTALVPLFDRAGGVLIGAPVVIEPPRDGTSTSPDTIKHAAVELHETHPYELVVMDGAAGGEQLAEWFEQELGCTVVVYSNGTASLALAYARFMEALREGALWHVGDPVLTRHCLNAVARLLPMGDHKFERPVGSRSAGAQDRRVIDCLSAASAGVSVIRAGGGQPSAYETGGLIVA